MGGIGAGLISLFVFYLIFALTAQFVIGQIAILIGSIALGVLIYRLCSEMEGENRTYLYGSIILSVLLGLLYYNAVLSETACDNYYIGKVFNSGYGAQQNGASITKENYSEVCHFSGLSYACSQYMECKSGLTALKPLALFFFGLLCSSIGCTLGMLKAVSKIKPNKSNAISNPINTSSASNLTIPALGLYDFQQENKEIFKQSTVEEIAKLTGRTERSIKAFITRHNLSCANYDSKKK